MRSDALVTASLMIAAVRDKAMSTRLEVATVGVISNITQNQATIPSEVEFVIDVRCSTGSIVKDICSAIFKRFDKIVQQENNSTITMSCERGAYSGLYFIMIVLGLSVLLSSMW